MGTIRDRLNSIAKNERLFSLNELYDNQDMLWNEYFTELVKKVEAMSVDTSVCKVKVHKIKICSKKNRKV